MEETNTDADRKYSIVPASTSTVLGRAVHAVDDHPVIQAILKGMGGAIAVLDSNCRVVAVNLACLEAAGARSSAEVLGFRPGEAFGCLHRRGEECGTSAACANCGVLLAAAAAQRDLTTIEGAWSISADSEQGRVELEFQVRAVPMQLEGVSFTLLALTNKTHERRRDGLERAFFSDMSRLITAMVALSCRFDAGDVLQYPEIAKKIQMSIHRLSREFEIQRALTSGDTEACTVCVEAVSIPDIFGEIQSFVGHYRTSFGAALTFVGPSPTRQIQTDPVLLARVLTNMVTNAMEASSSNRQVIVEVRSHRSTVEFRVWNAEAMSAAVAARVFERFFTTKAGSGRGHGCFIMKLLGEQYLGGKVSFTTSKEEGTTFRFELPKVLQFPFR